MLKYIIIIPLSLFIAFVVGIMVDNALKRRSYKAKCHAIMDHLLGLDFPLYAKCNIFANDEGLIFVNGKEEQRIPKEQLLRIEYYTEHDIKSRAPKELVKIGSIDGMVRNVPRGNDRKDLYVLVINYQKKPGDDVQVIGMVGDNPMHMLDEFTKGTNQLYGLVTLVEEKKIGLELPPEDE